MPDWKRLNDPALREAALERIIGDLKDDDLAEAFNGALKRGEAIMRERRYFMQREEQGQFACPKCGMVSGDSWDQCEGECPLAMSPHFDEQAHFAYGEPDPLRTQKQEEKPSWA